MLLCSNSHAQESMIPAWMRWGGSKPETSTPPDPFLSRRPATASPLGNQSIPPQYRTAANPTRPGTAIPPAYRTPSNPSAGQYPNTQENYAPLAQPAAAIPNNYPSTTINNPAGRQPPSPAPVVNINQYNTASPSGTSLPTTRPGAVRVSVSDSNQQQSVTNPASLRPSPNVASRQSSTVAQPWRGPTVSPTPQTISASNPATVSRFGDRTQQPQASYPPRQSIVNQQPRNNPPPANTGYQPQYQANVATTPPAASQNNSNRNTVAADEVFEPAKIVALVGGDPILAGDILGPINQMINQKLAELPKEQRDRISKEDIAKQQMLALKQILPGAIETRMVSRDFMRAIPPEKMEEFQERLDEQYDDLQLEADLENAKVNSPAELDIKLRSLGSSLAKKRRTFTEQMIAHQQLRRHIDRDEEVTHQQMLDQYRKQAATYQRPTKVKWEHLMVKFASFPDKQAAEHAIVDMGNQVLRGAPLDAVAKRQSQGIRAARGGQYDWTTQGGLKNTTIDQAIFTLPVGKMSQIIRSTEGLHIVRVTEREEASMEPFTEAQISIKKKIQDDRAKAQMQAYLDKVRLNTEIWTIFDEPEISTARAPTNNSQSQSSPTNSPVPSRFK